MKFTKHIVANMDDIMVQRCLICGTVISDYRNTMQPAGSPTPRGYAAGSIYVSDTRNPRISTIEEPVEYDVFPCKP